MSNWTILNSRARQQPLLPNLKTLEFASEDHSICGRDEVKWIRVLGTDAIQAIRFPYHDELSRCCFTKSTASIILRALVRRCPKVEELRIYPHEFYYDYGHSASDSSDGGSSGSEDGDDADNNSSLICSDFDGTWPNQMGEVLHLQTLALNDDAWLVTPYLAALARLPKLRTLEFHSHLLPRLESLHEFDNIEDTSPNLPGSDTLFPVLNRLILRQLNPGSVFQILKARTMLGKLGELHIDCDMEEDLEDRHCWIIDGFFPLLVYAPFLRRLGIENSYRFWDISLLAEAVCTPAIPKILDIMANLPLESVYLQFMDLGTGILDINLAIVWPSLTELSMPLQEASLWELSCFASIPNLQSLTVQLHLTEARFPPRIPSHKAPLTMLKGTYGSTLGETFGMMEHNAR